MLIILSYDNMSSYIYHMIYFPYREMNLQCVDEVIFFDTFLYNVDAIDVLSLASRAFPGRLRTFLYINDSIYIIT